MAHFFISYAGAVSLRVPLVLWSVYDIIVVVFLYSLVDLKRRYNGHGVRMAFWIHVCYSVAFGFPMGTATKVRHGQVSVGRGGAGRGGRGGAS